MAKCWSAAFPLTCPGAALEPHQGFISGAPYDSYVQLLACSISQTVNCFYLLADFCRTLIVPPLYPNSFSPPSIQLFRHPRFILFQPFYFYLKSSFVLCIPQMLIGLRETDDRIVSATFSALAVMVPILGAGVVVGGERSKYFIEGRPKVRLKILSLDFVLFYRFYCHVYLYDLIQSCITVSFSFQFKTSTGMQPSKYVFARKVLLFYFRSSIFSLLLSLLVDDQFYSCFVLYMAQVCRTFNTASAASFNPGIHVYNLWA